MSFSTSIRRRGALCTHSLERMGTSNQCITLAYQPVHATTNLSTPRASPRLPGCFTTTLPSSAGIAGVIAGVALWTMILVLGLKESGTLCQLNQGLAGGFGPSGGWKSYICSML